MRNVFDIATDATHVRHETPLGAAGRGAAAGLVATLLLSVLARITPGWGEQPDKQESKPALPEDPEQVRQWQARQQSPAAYKPAQPDTSASGPPDLSPSAVLVQPQAPGPEGAASQFAFKVASGIFGKDIVSYLDPAGFMVHVTYGSAWGFLYGLLQASYHHSPALFGLIYGLIVWLVGPAFLVPAMKLMRPLPNQPKNQIALMVAGHIVYGVSLAGVFEVLEKEAA